MNTTLGSHSNCNPTWNKLIQDIDNGLQGLELIALKIIHQYLPTQLHTEEIIQDLTQDVLCKVFSYCKDTNTKLKDQHPGPLITVIARNEIFKRMPKYLDEAEHIELEPDMVESKENVEEAQEQMALISEVRSHATERENRVLAKIIQGIPTNHADRQALYRLRARLAEKGVTAAL